MSLGSRRRATYLSMSYGGHLHAEVSLMTTAPPPPPSWPPAPPLPPPNASASTHCIFVTSGFFAHEKQSLQRKRSALQWYCALTVRSIRAARAPARIHVTWHAILHSGFANMTLPASCTSGAGLVTRQPHGPQTGASMELVRHVGRLRDEGHCGMALSFTRLDGDDALAPDALERVHAAVAPREACLARHRCACLLGSKRLLQVQLGVTADGAPRCAATGRSARDFWSLGQTVTLPWHVWRRRYPDGKVTFGAHHTLHELLASQLSPLPLHITTIDFLGYWAVTPLSGHYLPVSNEARCDDERLERVLVRSPPSSLTPRWPHAWSSGHGTAAATDRAAARLFGSAFAAFPLISSEDIEANHFYHTAHKDAVGARRAEGPRPMNLSATMPSTALRRSAGWASPLAPLLRAWRAGAAGVGGALHVGIPRKQTQSAPWQSAPPPGRPPSTVYPDPQPAQPHRYEV